MSVATTPAAHHTLSVLVENKSGVLARVVNLFSRRGYNIFSLAVAPTYDDRFSRITVVVDVDSAPLEQITKQLDKLINVVSITELPPSASLERELLVATVKLDAAADRATIVAAIAAAGGQVLAETATRLTTSLEAAPPTVDAFEDQLATFGITDLTRTGRVALRQLDGASVATA